MPPRLDGKVIAPPRLREAPEVFAVEQLRAISGRGAILKGQEDAGTLGKRWVVVTGLVPYKKQLAEYRDKFEGAAGERPRQGRAELRGIFCPTGRSRGWGSGRTRLVEVLHLSAQRRQ